MGGRNYVRSKRKNTKHKYTKRKNTRSKNTRRRTYRGGMNRDEIEKMTLGCTEERIMPIDSPLVATRRYGRGTGKNIKPELATPE